MYPKLSHYKLEARLFLIVVGSSLDVYFRRDLQQFLSLKERTEIEKPYRFFFMRTKLFQTTINFQISCIQRFNDSGYISTSTKT